MSQSRQVTPTRRKKKALRMWGLFNYDIFWEVGRTRKDCRDHAMRICGKLDVEKCFRDKSLRIVRVTVREE